MKCTLKPLRDERAREMFAHTAAKRRFANVMVTCGILPQIKYEQVSLFIFRRIDRLDQNTSDTTALFYQS